MEVPNVNTGNTKRAMFPAVSENERVVPVVSSKGNSTVRFNVNTKA